MNKEYINVDKNGYIKIPEYILEKDNDFFFVIGNIEIRMYPKKYLEQITEFLEPKNNKQEKSTFYGKRLIETYINKNRIKLPPSLLINNPDTIFIVKKDEHIKLFSDENNYIEYLDSIKKFKK